MYFLEQICFTENKYVSINYLFHQKEKQSVESAAKKTKLNITATFCEKIR